MNLTKDQKQIIKLLHMKKPAMRKRTYEELLEIIELLDKFRLDSEKERRFLGKIKRLSKFKTKNRSI